MAASVLWCQPVSHCFDRCRFPNVRKIANRVFSSLYPTQQASVEHEFIYAFELVCRSEDESHMRALLMQAIARSTLTVTSLKSEDIEGTPKNSSRTLNAIMGVQSLPGLIHVSSGSKGIVNLVPKLKDWWDEKRRSPLPRPSFPC